MRNDTPLFGWQMDLGAPSEIERILRDRVDAILDEKPMSATNALFKKEHGTWEALTACAQARWRGAWPELESRAHRNLTRAVGSEERAWFLFYSLLALQTQGKSDAAETASRSLQGYLLKCRLPALVAEHDYERARVLVRKGHYESALLRLPDAKAKAHLLQFQILNLRAVCLEALGRYAAARCAIRRARAVAGGIPSQSLGTLLLAREFGLAIESENFVVAKGFFKRQPQRPEDNDAELLLRLQQLRYAMATSDETTARAILAELEGHRKNKEHLLGVVLDSLGQSLAATGALGKAKLKEFLAESAGELERTTNDDSLCELHRARGLAFSRLGRSEDALREYTMALDIALEQSFQKAEVLIHAGLAMEGRRSAEERALLLRRTAQRARRMGLVCRALSFALVAAALEDKPWPVAEVLELEVRRASGLLVCRQAVQLCTAVDALCNLTDGEGRVRERGFLATVCALAQGIVACWYPKARTLLVRRGRTLHRVILPEGQAALLDALLKNPSRALPVQGVFAIAFPASARYVPERHRSRLTALLSRFRMNVRRFGIHLAHSSERQGFVLNGWEGLLVLETSPFTTMAPVRPLTARAEEILAFLRARQRATTAELMSHFGISRQSLNGHLKTLAQRRLVDMRARGKRTIYRALDVPSSLRERC